MLELDLRIGDRLIRPTEHQENLGLAGLLGLGAGFLLGSRFLKIGGAVVLGSAAYSVWEDSAAFVQPETMNSYFQTGGATSALGPAAAAPGLAGIGSRRGRRRR